MPTKAPIRRDPRNTGNGISPSHGFTVIELMITVALVFIITSLALPSYRTILEKRQVTSGAEQLGSFLSGIQIEAVKRNEQLAVSYARASSSSWCVGYTSGATACDCTITDVTDAAACLIDGQLRRLSSTDLKHPDIMNAMTGDNAFVYDPARGLMVDHSDKATLELLSDDGNYTLNVEVTATGRVRLCSKVSAKSVPGYKLCS